MSETHPGAQGRLLLSTSRFDVVEVQHQTRDGNLATRQIVRHPGAVVILPLLDADRVCLIRNQRVAASKTLIELPAGTIDPPESPSDTAKRELREETGFTAKNWRALPAFYTSPGILTERMFPFVADGLVEGHHAREPGEQIENLIVTWTKAIALAESGEIEDGKTLATLLLWDRLRHCDKNEN
jgi:ADP-ribose pyrophosphatase